MTDDPIVARLTELAAQQLEFELEINALVRRLKDKKKELAAIAEVELPDALSELGLTRYDTEDGLIVKIDTGLTVSVAPSGKWHAPVLAWLRRTDHDGIIKRLVAAEFDKGEDEAAGKLYHQLTVDGFRAVDRSEVNAQTFKALIRELLEEGETVPLEELGIGEWKRSTVEQKTKT